MIAVRINMVNSYAVSILWFVTSQNLLLGTCLTWSNSGKWTSWWRSIVVRPPVLAGELSLSCARLMAGRVTTL